MKKRRIRLTALCLLLIAILATVCYANEMSPRISSPASYTWYAKSSTANQYLMSVPAARASASGNFAYESPTSVTGEYTNLRIWVQYCGLEGYSTGTKCTDTYNFTASPINLYYTSDAGSTGYFRLEGRSNYGVFTVAGNWSPN